MVEVAVVPFVMEGLDGSSSSSVVKLKTVPFRMSDVLEGGRST